ncbi:MAG: hypothetical protein COY04_00225 [Parcubacteria group bacterium CG_4_10_14_0_2_um_filter_7_35_8]|nr:MAG: hypothetical protein COY04_00225 [Parcubacteria group bacterium CG_4_10_14_0_2_um_filter_7_35_8]
MIKKYSLLKSFGYAFDGLKTAFESEANFRIQTIMATMVILLSIILKFSYIETIILIMTIGLVLILELINTTIEILAGNEITAQAKKIKDISAGAVVLGAIMSIIIGLLLFIPKIWKFLL